MDINDAYERSLKNKIENQKERIDELIELETKRIDAKMKGIFNRIKHLPNEQQLLLMFIFISGIVFGRTVVSNQSLGQLNWMIEIGFGILFSYVYIYWIEQTDGDIIRQTEIRWRSLNPFPEHLYIDYRLIDFFYERIAYREVHQKGFEFSIEKSNDFCGLILDYEELEEKNKISIQSNLSAYLTLTDDAIVPKLVHLSDEIIDAWRSLIFGKQDPIDLSTIDNDCVTLRAILNEHIAEMKQKIVMYKYH